MGAGREVWVKIRASEAERAEWHANAGQLAGCGPGRSRTPSWSARAPASWRGSLEPEPDRPLGEHPQGERRGAGGGHASGRHRAGARHFDRAGEPR